MLTGGLRLVTASSEAEGHRLSGVAAGIPGGEDKPMGYRDVLRNDPCIYCGRLPSECRACYNARQRGTWQAGKRKRGPNG